MQVEIALQDIEKYYGANHVLKGVTFEKHKLSILETVIQTLKLQEDPTRNLPAKYKFKQEKVHKIVENLFRGDKSRCAAGGNY